ncbi:MULTISPECIES: PLP-dependent aminotransferase family protein [Marinomonas]|uniref:PLP-dependent aminotransferase family protein n=1 Tax=Marinomonas rhodophyticola TaxID=2992803 RepID=A0ABT3KCE8_9GAMM|nr:PLP-dependent aminotransferase family protein [Marinomonas sp. KJ51-3]MCW4628218.1 PLP-dependent aminotransferase family protein [Marinomonas sp. KJ51-3]
MNIIIEISKDTFDKACLAHPKYKALALLIEQAIQSGELPDRQKLPAQRLLADKLEITHGTVTRAYDLLEKKGLVNAKLGAGTYVNLPSSFIATNDSAIKEYDFASSMQPMLGQQMLIKNALNELAQDLLAIEQVMTYSPQGIQKHKQFFTDWLAVKKIKIDANDIAFTQGAQQGMYTCLQILTKENDYILHEELAYPGLFRAAQASRINPLSVPLTAQGLDLEVLEEYCQKFSPKVLYITPNIQNPTNIKYSQQQLSAIIELSEKYDFYIIEDDVNYCLPEHWNVPLQQQAPDRIFYLSSLSKYVAGGLRIAYCLVPKQWQQAFNLSIHSQCWMVSTLNFELATRFLNSENFKHNQSLLEEEMRYRQGAFQALAEKFGFRSRSGGLNAWLELPNHINVNQFNNFLASKNIKVRTADLFRCPTASLPSINCFRVSLGGFNSRVDFEQGLSLFENALIQFNSQEDIVI